ncbi:hypothetical protein K491DRAFT_720484 [Lophiostoma macrostomum CBS 122681]|uniref:Uncharacterized protein n=1 Tax=Lophiostoma macrostomum CBS 122681 TaxID=1314788 RepID=A0A6A6SWD8_9PLEO|nr:hypothetical protein K491DRAFT_720484 [Lophiostoma macrostomum CBS 122681]
MPPHPRDSAPNTEWLTAGGKWVTDAPLASQVVEGQLRKKPIPRKSVPLQQQRSESFIKQSAKVQASKKTVPSQPSQPRQPPPGVVSWLMDVEPADADTGSVLEGQVEKQSDVSAEEPLEAALETPREMPDDTVSLDYDENRADQGVWVKDPMNASPELLEELLDKSLEPAYESGMEIPVDQLPYIVGIQSHVHGKETPDITKDPSKSESEPVQPALLGPGQASSSVVLPGRQYFDPAREMFITYPAPQPATPRAPQPIPQIEPHPEPLGSDSPLSDVPLGLSSRPMSPIYAAPNMIRRNSKKARKTVDYTHWTKAEKDLIAKSVQDGLSYKDMEPLFSGRSLQALRNQRLAMVKKGAPLSQAEKERRGLRATNDKTPRILTPKGVGGQNKDKETTEIEWGPEEDQQLLRVWWENSHKEWLKIAQEDVRIPSNDRRAIVARRNHLLETRDPLYAKVMAE